MLSRLFEPTLPEQGSQSLIRSGLELLSCLSIACCRGHRVQSACWLSSHCPQSAKVLVYSKAQPYRHSNHCRRGQQRLQAWCTECMMHAGDC